MVTISYIEGDRELVVQTLQVLFRVQVDARINSALFRTERVYEHVHRCTCLLLYPFRYYSTSSLKMTCTAASSMAVHGSSTTFF
jgi:hypothetical protein